MTNNSNPTGIIPRLRGEWATLTFDERADTWRLRREAADKISELTGLLTMASSFDLIPFNPNGRWDSIRELKVERRRINPEAWSIGSEGKVLLRDGMWVIEPSPSNRDDAFLSEARWPTARDAIAFAREHMAQNPTGYNQEYRDLCWGTKND